MLPLLLEATKILLARLIVEQRRSTNSLKYGTPSHME